MTPLGATGIASMITMDSVKCGARFCNDKLNSSRAIIVGKDGKGSYDACLQHEEKGKNSNIVSARMSHSEYQSAVSDTNPAINSSKELND